MLPKLTSLISPKPIECYFPTIFTSMSFNIKVIVTASSQLFLISIYGHFKIKLVHISKICRQGRQQYKQIQSVQLCFVIAAVFLFTRCFLFISLLAEALPLAEALHNVHVPVLLATLAISACSHCIAYTVIFNVS